MPRIAIVGAGVVGRILAHRLMAHGCTPTLLSVGHSPLPPVLVIHPRLSASGTDLALFDFNAWQHCVHCLTSSNAWQPLATRQPLLTDKQVRRSQKLTESLADTVLAGTVSTDITMKQQHISQSGWITARQIGQLSRPAHIVEHRASFGSVSRQLANRVFDHVIWTVTPPEISPLLSEFGGIETQTGHWYRWQYNPPDMPGHQLTETIVGTGVFCPTDEHTLWSTVLPNDERWQRSGVPLPDDSNYCEKWRGHKVRAEDNTHPRAGYPIIARLESLDAKQWLITRMGSRGVIRAFGASEILIDKLLYDNDLDDNLTCQAI